MTVGIAVTFGVFVAGTEVFVDRIVGAAVVGEATCVPLLLEPEMMTELLIVNWPSGPLHLSTTAYVPISVYVNCVTGWLEVVPLWKTHSTLSMFTPTIDHSIVTGTTPGVVT